jgi:hypothetical protein
MLWHKIASSLLIKNLKYWLLTPFGSYSMPLYSSVSGSHSFLHVFHSIPQILNSFPLNFLKKLGGTKANRGWEAFYPLWWCLSGNLSHVFAWRARFASAHCSWLSLMSESGTWDKVWANLTAKGWGLRFPDKHHYREWNASQPLFAWVLPSFFKKLKGREFKNWENEWKTYKKLRKPLTDE